jgi:hypothetical protein
MWRTPSSTERACTPVKIFEYANELRSVASLLDSVLSSALFLVKSSFSVTRGTPKRFAIPTSPPIGQRHIGRVVRREPTRDPGSYRRQLRLAHLEGPALFGSEPLEHD